MKDDLKAVAAAAEAQCRAEFQAWIQEIEDSYYEYQCGLCDYFYDCHAALLNKCPWWQSLKAKMSLTPHGEPK